MTVSERDKGYMRIALLEAEAAADQEEIPVGAVFVHGDKVIARSRNQCEGLGDPTAHAEMIGITQACAVMEAQRLTSVEVFVTKEPCLMCIGALVHARVQRLVIGTPDFKVGACGSVIDVAGHPALNHSLSIDFGVLEHDCRALLQSFFRSKR